MEIKEELLDEVIKFFESIPDGPEVTKKGIQVGAFKYKGYIVRIVLEVPDEKDELRK